MHLRQVRAANWSLLVRRATALALAAGLAFTAPSSWADRTPLKPGINMYSTADDIRMGQKLADEAEAKLPMLNDARVEDYLNRLGRKLASFAPGAKYPYEFHCVNSDALNAFALPGGFVFVNRAVIEESRDEAQLAGVIAHEIGHVALRHGTNQATKKEMGSDLVGIAGGEAPVEPDNQPDGGLSIGAIRTVIVILIILFTPLRGILFWILFSGMFGGQDRGAAEAGVAVVFGGGGGFGGFGGGSSGGGGASSSR